MKRGRRSKIAPADLEGLDWDRTAQQIAVELRVSVDTVRRWAAHLGQTLKADKPGVMGVDWNAVDWSEPDNGVIARKVNRTRQRVAQMRPKTS